MMMIIKFSEAEQRREARNNLLKSAKIILANRMAISLSVSAYSVDICILSIDKHLSCLMR